MSEKKEPQREVDLVVTDEALKKAEQYIEEEEGAINKLPGALGMFTTALAVILSVFHLYAAYGIMPTHVLRGIHVAFILFLGFLLFPVAKRFRHRVCWWDWLAARTSIPIVCNMRFGRGAVFGRRQCLRRLPVRRDGRQPDRRGQTHCAGVISARRTVGKRRCDDRNAGFGRLSDAGQSGLRQGRSRRPSGRGRIRRDYFAAG